MKYKLIKEYPGSPKLGIEQPVTQTYDFLHLYPEFWKLIVEYPIDTKVFNEQTKAIYIKKEDGWYKTSDKTAYTDEMIAKSNYINIIKDKVVEKDYEILSFVIINPNKSHTLLLKDSQLKDIFSIKDGKAPFYNLDNLLNKTYTFKIHSVKRLSDSEVFTIGDYILSDTKSQIITDFVIQEDKIRVNYKNPIDTQKYWNYLVNITKRKTPLFKTEDGVDIFEGDKFYFLQKDWLKVLNNYGQLIASKNTIAEFAYKRFSTKEKAEEYILLNKPCLSYNEVLNATKIRSKNTFDTLKDLVKSKI